MSLQDEKNNVMNKLQYLNNTKYQIRQSIGEQNVEIKRSDTFRSFADKIDNIIPTDSKYEQLLQETNNGKNILISATNQKGGNLSSNASFTQIANGVNNLSPETSKFYSNLSNTYFGNSGGDSITTIENFPIITFNGNNYITMTCDNVDIERYKIKLTSLPETTTTFFHNQLGEGESSYLHYHNIVPNAEDNTFSIQISQSFNYTYSSITTVREQRVSLSNLQLNQWYYIRWEFSSYMNGVLILKKYNETTQSFEIVEARGLPNNRYTILNDYNTYVFGDGINGLQLDLIGTGLYYPSIFGNDFSHSNGIVLAKDAREESTL